MRCNPCSPPHADPYHVRMSNTIVESITHLSAFSYSRPFCLVAFDVCPSLSPSSAGTEERPCILAYSDRSAVGFVSCSCMGDHGSITACACDPRCAPSGTSREARMVITAMTTGSLISVHPRRITGNRLRQAFRWYGCTG